MKKFTFIVLILFSFLSCQNSDSDEYINIENEAINDIILEMTDFEEMKKLNNWKNQKLKLYIVSKLDTTTAGTPRPTGYDTSSNGIKYSKEKIEENKKNFEINSERYRIEEGLFAELKKGRIKARNLDYPFESDKLDIEFVESVKFRKFNPIENEFGYLSISRIIFNKDFTTGYLHYNFICGTGCAWHNNIEIKKVNGKWVITDYFSGGMA